MAEQMRPSSPNKAPDPASGYGREKPHKEAGMGRLDNNVSTPTNQPDQPHQAVKNRQEPRQVNAHETDDQRAARQPGQQQPDHSMHDEEGLDEQYPKNIVDPRQKRQPRVGGKGGTPDAGESTRDG